MLQKIGYDYDPSEWRTIPHNENEKPAIFVDHATGLQKKYSLIQLLLNFIDCK